MQSNQQQSENFDVNKLYMWRCIVAMAHADKILHNEEKKYLLTMFNNMKSRAGLPEEHLNTLMADLNTPQDISTLLPHMTAPKYRAQVIYFARLLAYKDNELHPSEEAVLKTLKANALSNEEQDAIKEQIHYSIQNDMVSHELDVDSDRPTGFGLSSLLDKVALYFGIDLMDE